MARTGSVSDVSIKLETKEDTKGHNFDREFIFGPAKNGQKDFKNINWVYCSYKACQNFYHFARPPSSITLNTHDENYGGLITSMQCDGGIKMGGTIPFPGRPVDHFSQKRRKIPLF